MPGQVARAQERTSFPPEARKLYEEGRELQKKGKFREAIEAYDQAAKLGMKEYPRIQLYQASSHLGLKELDAAILQYTRFLQEFTIENSCRY